MESWVTCGAGLAVLEARAEMKAVPFETTTWTSTIFRLPSVSFAARSHMAVAVPGVPDRRKARAGRAPPPTPSVLFPTMLDPDSVAPSRLTFEAVETDAERVSGSPGSESGTKVRSLALGGSDGQ